jgi:hypothetical protein
MSLPRWLVSQEREHMKSQRKSDEHVFDDWASLHGRLLPWSEDQTTTQYESAHLRYLQRQPSSNEPSYGERERERQRQLDEARQRNDEDDNPFARERSRTGAWLARTAAVSGLIAAVLFGRVLLYGTGAAHAAAPASTPEPAPAEVVAPPPSAANSPPSVDTSAPQSALEVSHPTLPNERPRHSSTSHSHARSEPPTHVEHEPAHTSDTEAAPNLVRAPPPGTLRINSRPWSQVFIDDRLIGNTPQLDISLAAGSHTVRLTNPEFGMSKVIRLRVPAGETVTRVETLEESE